ncbi:MAG TPA: Veg protein [Firmicutes bacterium]|nr:Veg protein [Bacillota bacterium]
MTRAALSNIRKDLQYYIGRRVRVKTMKGRRQTLEKEGILENTYPNIFIIRVDDQTSTRRLSYSYTDILTESVELFLEGENGSQQYLPSAQSM